MLHFLLHSGLTGISEIQQSVIEAMGEGLSDKEIAERQKISASTVRNHRFKLREKECKNDTHTNGDILSNGNAIFLTAFQCENDVSLYIHKLGVFEMLHPKVHPRIDICNDIKRYLD